MEEVIVSISCITYNHENYIKQCLDGFLMQKTNFPIEIIIHDDASTDNTAKIIQEYAAIDKRIKPILRKTNIKSTGVLVFPITLKKAVGKYIALCDGDDYWTDPLKLQKQVDFLEAHKDYGMVHTQINKLFDATNEIISISKDRSKTSFVELLKENPIATLTTMIRKDLLVRYIKDVQPQTKKWIAGDTPIWLWFSIHSKIYFIDEITATYRVRLGSMSNVIGSKKYLDFIKSRLSIRKFFVDKYFNSDKKYLDIIYQSFYKDAEYNALKEKEKEIIKGISEYYANNKNDIKSMYFKTMSKLIRFRCFYSAVFFIYRVYYKLKRMFQG